MDLSNSIPPFKTLDTDPSGTAKRFTEYVEEMKLVFQLAFRKADGTGYTPNDQEKKACMLLRGGKDMRNLYQFVGKVLETDTFDQAVEKINNGLASRTNKVVQRNLLLTGFPQGSKSFEPWTQDISEAAKSITYTGYDWKQAAVDAILLQTSNTKLRERALQEDISYEELLKLGIAKEQSVKGAALLEKASGQSHSTPHTADEEVRRLTLENKKLRKKVEVNCGRCGNKCKRGNQCPANGQKCGKCGKMNHFARACRSKKEEVALLSSDSSDESCGRIITSNNKEIPEMKKRKRKAFLKKSERNRRKKQENIETRTTVKSEKKHKKEKHENCKNIEQQVEDKEDDEIEARRRDKKRRMKMKYKSKKKIIVKKFDSSITAKIEVQGMLPFNTNDKTLEMSTDTGVKKTIVSYNDWQKIKRSCGIVKTSKKFRPYGTPLSLNILGKARVTMKAEAGAEIETWVYIHKSSSEKSLLGEKDARRLGIVILNLKGADKEVELNEDEEEVKCIAYTRKDPIPT